MNGELKSKLIKLRKGSKLWETPALHLANPYAKTVGTGKNARTNRTMSFASVGFKLPIETVHIETIVVGGVIVWDYNQEPVRSSIIGGGGRFVHARQYYDRTMVMQNIVFKDLPFYSEQLPDIDVVIAVFVPGTAKGPEYKKKGARK